MSTSAIIEVPKVHSPLEEYLQYGPQYDTVNDCPMTDDETEVVRPVSYKKLSTDTRRMLHSVMAELVICYWQENRQIPFGKTSKNIRQEAILETYRLTGQYAKDSDELKHNLNECIISTINKELSKEQ